MKTNTLLKSALLLALPAMVIFSSCKKNKDDESSPSNNSNSVDFKTQTLSGDNEVPASGSSASGTFSGSYDQSSNVITYNLVYSGVTPTSMHFHYGLPGMSGPVAVTLTTPTASPASGTATLTDAQEDSLMAGKLYINIHSTAHAAGDIRAQVLTNSMVVFSNELTGDNEVPSSGSTATAMFNAVYNKTNNNLAYAITDYSGAAANAAHIHYGKVGTNGGVLVTLTTPPASGAATGMATFTQAQEDSLLNGKLYVNVHTAGNGNGEVRTQLTTNNFIVFQTPLVGSEEVPSVITTGTAMFYGMYDNSTSVLTYTIVQSGLTSTVQSAHIHEAAAGANGNVVFTLVTPVNATTSGTTAAFSSAQEVKLKSGAYYVNIHTSLNTGGEVRGQILIP